MLKAIKSKPEIALRRNFQNPNCLASTIATIYWPIDNTNDGINYRLYSTMAPV